MIFGNINDSMQKGIDDSQSFICCASTNYCKSENSIKEFNYAIAIRKPILYVLVEKIKGEDQRMEKLKQISFHMAGKIFYKHTDIKIILKALYLAIDVRSIN